MNFKTEQKVMGQKVNILGIVDCKNQSLNWGFDVAFQRAIVGSVSGNAKRILVWSHQSKQISVYDQKAHKFSPTLITEVSVTIEALDKINDLPSWQSVFSKS